MKVKELIDHLKEFDENLDVFINSNYTSHNCSGDDRCYCSNEDHISNPKQPILVEDMFIYYQYIRKRRKNGPPGVVINTDYLNC